MKIIGKTFTILKACWVRYLIVLTKKLTDEPKHGTPIFGEPDSLRDFLFENGIQHQVFWERLTDAGFYVPRYPIIDADPQDLDDWLLIHQQEHQRYATILNLNDPFNLLDLDFNQEDDFYDWVNSHLLIHEQIARTLGVT